MSRKEIRGKIDWWVSRAGPISDYQTVNDPWYLVSCHETRWDIFRRHEVDK